MRKTRLLPMLLSALLLTTACPGDPECGNGEVEDTEQCDDGNKVAGDGCENNCTKTAPATCGNGVKDSGEECDDGNQVPGDGCENNCTATPTATCGNGVKEAGEACDDGNSVNDDGCTNDCKLPGGVCGDGQLNAGEECDDGNQVNGDGCENDCTETVVNPVCGNGTKETGEECDDGNTVSGDGCEADCKLPRGVCGDGTVNAGEECDDGNAVAGDGCEPNCRVTPTPTEIRECATLPATGNGRTCEVTNGSSSMLIKGDILVPGTVYRGGQVLVDGSGKITCVDCDCSAQAAGATVVSCPDAVVSPGLINAHDHITYANNKPYVAAPDKATERFEHRHDWRKGLRGHTKITVQSGASAVAISGAELRFVLGGATSTVSSGSAPGLLRNLDKDNAQEGLNKPAVDYETFPLGDSGGTLISDGCGYSKFVESSANSYVPHIAEGIDVEAHNEFLCVETDANGGKDLVKTNAAFIHGVAALPPDTAWMALDGAKLIWSPRTNVSLYGDTAPVTLYSRSGALIALGTDWLPSGSTSMLRELKCVADLNSTYYDNFFTDEDMWKMTTVNAAKAAAMDDVIGILAPGRFADIAIFRKNTNADYRAVIEAEAEDVALVLRAGKAMYGDDNLIDAVTNTGGCAALDVCGESKKACTGDSGATLAAIKTEAEKYSPLFACNGAPPDEPTCQPFRATSVKSSTVYDGLPKAGDLDGDGIGDDEDNCPRVFNPIRPMDNGKQPDFDKDGVGDACDPCPLSAAPGNCPLFTPGDYDMDGAADGQDNCFAVPNADQQDTDHDGIGDLCDKCPLVPGACPATVYEVKTGAVAEGDLVTIDGVVVTGVDPKGFFVQVPENSAAYDGADNSGLYVFLNAAPSVARGDRIALSGKVGSYYGQKQLTNATATLQTAAEPLPAPVVVSTADVTTGGPRAAALEGVIVKVEDVIVSNANPDAPGNYNEFEVSPVAGGAGLRVDDLMFLSNPMPAVGDEFGSITGALVWRNSNSKIEPRDAEDFVEANPTARIAAIEPSFGYLRVGTQGPTFPQQMKIKLLKAMPTDTVVPVTVSDATVAEVVGGGVTIAAGQTEGVIEFNPLAAAATAITVSAEINNTSATAEVRVLDGAEQPASVEVSPSATIVQPAATKTFTVTIDIPAPAGGVEITLAAAPVDGGTLPATVTVAEGQISADFDFVAGATEQQVTITATMGTATDSSTVEIMTSVPTSHLIINEVDYDQIDSDEKEFLEIYNPTANDVALAGLSVVFFNGNNNACAEYARVELGTGTLPAGGYLVLATSTVTVAQGAITVALPAASNNIQNGAPDGIALIDTAAGAVVDALSYEGEVASCTISDISAPFSLVEGTVLAAAVADSNTEDGSLARLPNGTDTDDANTDWKYTKQPTPGAENVLLQ